MRHHAHAGGRPADFAHLMGAPAGRARADSDQDDEAQKKAKARAKQRAEEDERRKKEDARRAEEDISDVGDMPDEDEPDADQEPDCPECDGSGEADDGTTCELCGGDGKVHVDDQPQDVDDMDGTEDAKAPKSARAATKAERSRWTKVLGHKACAGRVAAACAMLANGEMSANAILATLKVLPAQASAGGGLRERMSAERPKNPGVDRAPPRGSENEQFAAEVSRAAAKARGERT